jgi:hypothetical protein
MSERLVINSENQKHIEAYLEYKRIVGEDDGGKLMSDQEFEAYKKKVAEARKNHLYVFWVNPKGFECKAIGPESMCFCGHRYKSHNFDNIKTKKVNCKTAKCKCSLFDYVPVYGSNDVKCLCKHSYSLHNLSTRGCTKPGCKCSSFGSKFTCNCTFTYDDHMTTIENREERLSQGKTVDPGWMSSNMNAGIGGLNSFSSMMNDVYQLEYKALLEQPDKKLMIMEEIKSKKQLGSGNSLSISNNEANNININITTSGNINEKIKNSSIGKTDKITPFDLFLTPHKFVTSNLNNKMGRLSLK